MKLHELHDNEGANRKKNELAVDQVLVRAKLVAEG